MISLNLKATSTLAVLEQGYLIQAGKDTSRGPSKLAWRCVRGFRRSESEWRSPWRTRWCRPSSCRRTAGRGTVCLGLPWKSNQHRFYQGQRSWRWGGALAYWGCGPGFNTRHGLNFLSLSIIFSTSVFANFYLEHQAIFPIQLTKLTMFSYSLSPSLSLS